MARQTCGLNAGTHIIPLHVVVVDFTSVEIHHAHPRQTPRVFDEDTAALTTTCTERSVGAYMIVREGSNGRKRVLRRRSRRRCGFHRCCTLPGEPRHLTRRGGRHPAHRQGELQGSARPVRGNDGKVKDRSKGKHVLRRRHRSGRCCSEPHLLSRR